MEKALIIGNGKLASKKVLDYLVNSGPALKIATDGGANNLLKTNIIPDIIIGDMDSISLKALNTYIDKSKFIKNTKQDDTDLEKAIKYLLQKKITEANLISFGGGRLDHTFNNIGILLKYSDRIKLKMIDAVNYVSVYNKDIEFSAQIGEIISIYGFDEKLELKSEGLEYPLNDIKLIYGSSDGTSNKAIDKKIKLSITGGKILVFRDLKIGMKNGFILHS